MKQFISDEIKVFSDILVVNVIDSYMNLTLKSVFILKYLSDINGLSDNLKTVMKTDDDCYVNIQALAHLTKMGNMGKTFIGKFWLEFDMWIKVIQVVEFSNGGFEIRKIFV